MVWLACCEHTIATYNLQTGGNKAIATQTKLRQIRTELGVSQEDVSRLTVNVKLTTYRNCEQGGAVRYETATQITNAINKLLQDAGRPQTSILELGINLY